MTSQQEPEALNELAEKLYKMLSGTVRTVITFPAGPARVSLGERENFKTNVDRLSENVLAMANGVVKSQGLPARFQMSSISTDLLTEVNDSIIDKVYFNSKLWKRVC